MSGPKYSRATIKRINELERLKNELEKQIEEGKRNQVLSDIKTLETEQQKLCCNLSLNEYDNVIYEAEKLVPGSKTLFQLKSVIASIREIMTKKCSKSGNSEQLLKNLSYYKSDIQKLKNSVELIKDLRNQLSAEGTEALQEGRLSDFLSTEWTDTGEKIETIPSDLQDIYYEVLGLLSESDNYENNKKIIDEIIMHTGDIGYRKKQLELRKNALLVEKNSSQNNIEMLSCINELRGLYSLLGWEAKSIPVTLAEINKTIDDAQNTLKQQQAAKYIAESVHKVFESKGYSLLEENTVLNSSGQVETDFYQFGEESLINVSMSDKGQMLFEVVGDCNSDEMDEKHIEQLVSEMHRFCPNYAEIKEELRSHYGIELEDEHLFAPDAKYAKAANYTSSKGERRANKEKKLKHLNE